VSETTNITMTESQINELRRLDEVEYRFPSAGRARSCEKLEAMGLAESDHRLFKQVYIGSERHTEFRLAYRLTALGKKCQGKKLSPNPHSANR
jgi:hypothetical protein